MARQPRVGVEGGLYHVIARGNNRRRIFDAPDDYQKFLSLLEIQKESIALLSLCLLSDDFLFSLDGA
jgi:REP element-mobilizing transposase RayT